MSICTADNTLSSETRVSYETAKAVYDRFIPYLLSNPWGEDIQFHFVIAGFGGKYCTRSQSITNKASVPLNVFIDQALGCLEV